MDRATASGMEWWRRMRRGAAALFVVPVVLTACGGDDDETTTTTTETTMPATTTTTGPQRYTIEPGDTLVEIAERFDTSVDALVEENGISDPDRIQPGDELVIPGDAGDT